MWTNKKGISPIVGVILVVAMTVLLAAIAWTYMSGMVSSPGKQYQVGMKVERTANGLTITYVGGPDQDKVSSLTITVYDTNDKKWYNGTAWTDTESSVDIWNNPTVGKSTVIDITGRTDHRFHVTVQATFKDGTKQVIYDSVV